MHFLYYTKLCIETVNVYEIYPHVTRITARRLTASVYMSQLWGTWAFHATHRREHLDKHTNKTSILTFASLISPRGLISYSTRLFDSPAAQTTLINVPLHQLTLIRGKQRIVVERNENPCKLRFITSCCKFETKARPAIVDMPNLHVVPGSTVSSTLYRPKWPASQPASLPACHRLTVEPKTRRTARSLKDALYSYLKQVPTLHVNEANNLIKVLSRWIHNSKTLQIHK